MTRPAFADILDLSAPFHLVTSVDPRTDEEEAQPTEVDKFIARRRKKRKTR